MSSLATAVAATRNTTTTSDEEVRDKNNTPHDSPQSKTSNQDMEIDGSEELGQHLDKLVNEVDTEENPRDEEISFGDNQTYFRPPSFNRAFVAQDLRTPDLPHIFWASIRIPVPSAPSNATDAMFDALDDFITKMKEADR